MEEQVLHFADQFAWVPEIIRAKRLPEDATHFIVCGMGGSHLGARLLLRHNPTLNLTVHNDYGLPGGSVRHLRTALVIACSYSGETEETLDAAQKAADAGLSVAVVTTGGALARFAEDNSLPLILMPKQSVEPRMAVGACMLALARLMRDGNLENDIREAGANVNVRWGKADGEMLAKRLVGSVPLVYASSLNASLAYVWKIAFNETSKSPAFYNLFPELCHNELSGFDGTGHARAFSPALHVLLLRDSDDDPRIVKRMRLMQELLEARAVGVSTVEIIGGSGLEKALNGVLAGVWTALALAKEYGAPDAATPLIAEFKQKMKDI